MIILLVQMLYLMLSRRSCSCRWFQTPCRSWDATVMLNARYVTPNVIFSHSPPYTGLYISILETVRQIYNLAIADHCQRSEIHKRFYKLIVRLITAPIGSMTRTDVKDALRVPAMNVWVFFIHRPYQVQFRLVTGFKPSVAYASRSSVTCFGQNL